jgi:hypothetical protein
MPRPLPARFGVITVYLVWNEFGSAYVRTDPAEADRDSIIRNLLWLT